MLPSQIVEQGWCQGFYAYDKDGNHTQAGNKNAVTHCIIGAINACAFRRIYNKKITDLIEVYVSEAAIKLGYASMARYNDDEETSKDDIVALLKEAELVVGIG